MRQPDVPVCQPPRSNLRLRLQPRWLCFQPIAVCDPPPAAGRPPIAIPLPPPPPQGMCLVFGLRDGGWGGGGVLETLGGWVPKHPPFPPGDGIFFLGGWVLGSR